MPGVAVTIEPQRYFAEKIAGEYFSVHTVVPPGQSPETYDPSPYEMVRIAQSRAYLQIGRIGFEQAWMDAVRKNNPQVRFFDLSEGVEWIENGHDYEAAHGHRHDHFDPHIWTSTVNAEIIAHNVLQAFIGMDSVHEHVYRDNFRQLTDEIGVTRQILHGILDTLSCRTFVIYHPALTYFAGEFGLTQLAIEADGKEPSALSMRALVDRARAAGVEVVFVQQEFDRKHAEQLAVEINARVVVINPLDRRWNEQLVFIANALCGRQSLCRHE
ncbi:MAG: zinc ABC transporter substrate-binding protein [Tannerella sp.]|nr:zinc ABC transporter substrate-binding protein [Tannerella sp.]